MRFDIYTLYLTNVAVLFVAAIMALLYWLQHRDQIAMRQWALAMGLGGIGTLLLGLFGPIPTQDHPAIVGNTLVVAGIIVGWEAMRRFNGRAAANGRVVALSVAFMILFGVAWYFGADLRQRVVIGALALAVFAGLASLEIGFGGKHEPLSSRTTTAVIFGIVAMDMLIRAADAIFAPPALQGMAFFEDPIQSHAMFAMTIGLVCLSVSGLSTMAHERLLNRFERLAFTDELTQLPNRRYFFEQAERVARRAAAGGTPACVLMMDLDRFSRINEQFGHIGGDRVLAAFATALRGHLRPDDLVGRYGGEEFCALLVDTDIAGARKIADRLRAAIADLSIDIKGRSMRFTVSMGLTALQGDGFPAAIERADEALYRAKHEGRDRIAVADEEAVGS